MGSFDAASSLPDLPHAVLDERSGESYACWSCIRGSRAERIDLNRGAFRMMTKCLGRLSAPRRFFAVFGIAVIAASILPGVINTPLTAQATAKQPQQIDVPDWPAAAGEKLVFEVATVKPNATDNDAKVNFTLGPGDAYAKTGGRFLASNISLFDYIRFAYKLTDGQAQILQADAPNWVTTKRFDIEAKSENPDVTKDQMRLMMQSLLAERFELIVHTETRQLPVLALVLAKPGKLGPQLWPHPSEDDTCSNVAARTDQNSDLVSASTLPAVCGGLVSTGVPSAPSHVRIGGRKISMALIAAHLGEMGQFGRPVVDRTGLRGTFDFVLEWGPDASLDSATAPDHDAMQTNVEEALQDQLGLKLERQKAPVKVLLIDHIDEHPTEN